MHTNNQRLSTGLKGLDKVLQGGLLPQSTNLVRGGPGLGKTTIGIHFLLKGLEDGDSSLFITLGETTTNIRNNAKRLGLDLTGVEFLDLSPESDFFSKTESYDIFDPAEVEKQPTTSKIVETIENKKPKRVFLDAITQFKFLATSEYQYRKQVLSFLRYLKENGATVMFTTENTPQSPDDDMQFHCDCMINLKKQNENFVLNVPKFRGSDSISGTHTYKFLQGGIQVFPNVVPPMNLPEIAKHQLSFGVKEIDNLLHGGIESGTVSIIAGPSGVGKTTLSMQLAAQTAIDGFKSAIYTFEERKEMMLRRSDGVNMPIRQMVEKGKLHISSIEPLLYSADEFAYMVSNHVESEQLSLVIIDSTVGYSLSVNTDDVNKKLHALCKYLQKNGVTVILIEEIRNITGDFNVTEIGLSYLADNLLFLRFLEIHGKMEKAIGVIKKRLSDFENTLRSFRITDQGIYVGEPLTNLRGILSGTPEWTDKYEEN